MTEVVTEAVTEAEVKMCENAKCVVRESEVMEKERAGDGAGQQWDFPNAWAPEQMFIIEGLRHTADQLHIRQKGTTDEAFALAQKWVTTTYSGWAATGDMFEKYDCRVAGAPGGGGREEEFGTSLTLCPQEESTRTKSGLGGRTGRC